MIIRYIRDKNNRLKGCVVRLDNGRLGYSLCHPNDQKKNSKKLAREIAIGRASKTVINLYDKGMNYKQRDDYSIYQKCTPVSKLPEMVIPYLKELQNDELS